MKRFLQTLFSGFDGILLGAMVSLSVFGLATMYSLSETNALFNRQLWWLLASIIVFLLAIIPNYRFLKMGNIIFYSYIGILLLLGLVLVFGEDTLGARQRFDLGVLYFQVSDPAKIILIALLAKYFAKRHELIGDFKHIIVSGIYTSLMFILIFMQPDFGTAIIIFLIWLGMVLVAGIKLRHIITVFSVGVLAFMVMWQFIFYPYQKARIMNFFDPLADVQNSGYSAYQSTVTFGSGQVFGKGVGYGTQSKLLYLPEYETDFIYAAFAEEWGLIGVVVSFGLFGIIIWRLLYYATIGVSNFEKLFAVGVVIFLLSHFFLHVGINIGLLPVTGTTVPFLSYGGSHLLTEFLAVAIVLGMSRRVNNYKNSVKEVFPEAG